MEKARKELPYTFKGKYYHSSDINLYGLVHSCTFDTSWWIGDGEEDANIIFQS